MPEFPGTLIPPKLAVAPGSAVEGQMYYDTALKCIRVWNGTQWVHEAMEQIGNRVILDGTSGNGTATWAVIPSYFNHLQIRGKVIVAPAGNFVSILRFNDDAGANYWNQQMWSFSNTLNAANTGWVSYGKCIGDLNNQGYASFICDIIAIRSSSAKEWVSQISGWTSSGSIGSHQSGLWNSNSIINKVTLGAGTFMIGELTLWGIR